MALAYPRLADQHLGWSFQFADYLGVGLQPTKRTRISPRYTHYSSGGIAPPNDGLDLVQLAFAHGF